MQNGITDISSKIPDTITESREKESVSRQVQAIRKTVTAAISPEWNDSHVNVWDLNAIAESYGLTETPEMVNVRAKLTTIMLQSPHDGSMDDFTKKVRTDTPEFGKWFDTYEQLAIEAIERITDANIVQRAQIALDILKSAIFFEWGARLRHFEYLNDAFEHAEAAGNWEIADRISPESLKIPYSPIKIEALQQN